MQCLGRLDCHVEEMGVYISQLDLLVIDVPFLPGLIFRSLNPVQDVEQALLADVDLERTEDTECWAA